MARKPLRPLIRSGGFYPSRKWTPLVYAGGYTTANGGGEPEPPPIEKTVTGNPIHILDALAKPVQALSVKLEPIQDLHGYDAPWPAGGGKNLFPLPTTAETKSGVTVEATSSGEIWVHGTPTIASGYLSFSMPPVSQSIIGQTATISINEKIAGIGLSGGASGGGLNLSMSDTITSRTALYSSVANDPTLNVRYDVGTIDKKFKIQLEIGSSVTAWTPYSNICPIYGHTDADVVRTGKNLLDPNERTDGPQNILFYRETGFLLKANQTYTFSIYSSENAAGLYIYRLSDASYLSVKYNDKTLTYTPAEDVLAYFNVYYSPAPSGGTSSVNCQLELGSTASAYSPYVGTTYPIPLGQTVYGGTLDVLTGVLTVTNVRSMFTEDLAISNWYTHDATWDTWGFYSNYDNIWQNVIGYRPKGNLISDKFKTVSSVYVTDAVACSMAIQNGYMQYIAFRIPKTLIDTPSDSTDLSLKIKAWLADNPIGICFEIEPIVYQLSPQQVELLLGENNIWSDGTMTLVYLADGNASDEEALNILLGGRYANNHGEDEPTDREALDILLGR